MVTWSELVKAHKNGFLNLDKKHVPCPCDNCRTMETTCKLTCDRYKKWKEGE